MQLNRCAGNYIAALITQNAVPSAIDNFPGPGGSRKPKGKQCCAS
jgi:hypothetical protein